MGLTFSAMLESVSHATRCKKPILLQTHIRRNLQTVERWISGQAEVMGKGGAGWRKNGTRRQGRGWGRETGRQGEGMRRRGRCWVVDRGRQKGQTKAGREEGGWKGGKERRGAGRGMGRQGRGEGALEGGVRRREGVGGGREGGNKTMERERNEGQDANANEKNITRIEPTYFRHELWLARTVALVTSKEKLYTIKQICKDNSGIAGNVNMCAVPLLINSYSQYKQFLSIHNCPSCHCWDVES